MFVNTSDTLNSRTTPLSEFWETMNSYRLVMFNEGKSVPPLLGMTKKYNVTCSWIMFCCTCIWSIIILWVSGCQDSAREVMCPWQPFFSEGESRGSILVDEFDGFSKFRMLELFLFISKETKLWRVGWGLVGGVCWVAFVFQVSQIGCGAYSLDWPCIYE